MYEQKVADQQAREQESQSRQAFQQQIQDKFELFASFSPILIIYGSGGSGKSALVKVLLKEMCDHIGLDQTLSHKWILQVWPRCFSALLCA